MDVKSGILNLREIAAPATPPTGEARAYFKVDGKLYVKDDAGVETLIGPVAGGGGGGLPKLSSRLTAAVSSSVVTYGPTGLSVTLTAAKVYRLTAFGQYQTAALTTGISFRLGGTATATRVRYSTRTVVSATGNWYRDVSSLNASPTPSSTVGAAATDYGWGIDGLIVAAAGGTLTVDFASEVAASAATIQPDSYFEAQEVA